MSCFKSFHFPNYKENSGLHVSFFSFDPLIFFLSWHLVMDVSVQYHFDTQSTMNFVCCSAFSTLNKQVYLLLEIFFFFLSSGEGLPRWSHFTHFLQLFTVRTFCAVSNIYAILWISFPLWLLTKFFIPRFVLYALRPESQLFVASVICLASESTEQQLLVLYY